MTKGSGTPAYWQHQAPAELDVTPIQNTWYPVLTLALVNKFRMIWHAVRQDNDEAVGKNIEYRWTIDGQVKIGGATLDNATAYQIYLDSRSAFGTSELNRTTGVMNSAEYTYMAGKSLLVEVRITAVVGTNQRLRSKVEYDLWR